MKFDAIVGNPPYKSSLHLKFLDFCYEKLKYSGQLVMVHPSYWMLNMLSESMSRYEWIKNKIDYSVSSIEYINGNKKFNSVAFYSPLLITHINRKHTGTIKVINYQDCSTKYVRSINDANTIGPYQTIKSIENKIRAVNTLDKYINKHLYDDPYYFTVNSMSSGGSIEALDYNGNKCTFKCKHSIVNNQCSKITKTPQISKKGNIKNWMQFETEEEAQEMLDFVTRSKLHKYIMIVYNLSNSMMPLYKYTPVLDCKIKWNDDKINKHFNFTEEEIELINKTVEKYKI
jgi:hypothetical protein